MNITIVSHYKKTKRILVKQEIVQKMDAEKINHYEKGINILLMYLLLYLHYRLKVWVQ